MAEGLGGALRHRGYRGLESARPQPERTPGHAVLGPAMAAATDWATIERNVTAGGAVLASLEDHNHRGRMPLVAEDRKAPHEHWWIPSPREKHKMSH